MFVEISKMSLEELRAEYLFGGVVAAAPKDDEFEDEDEELVDVYFPNASIVTLWTFRPSLSTARSRPCPIGKVGCASWKW